MHQAAAELLSSRIWLEEIFRISRQLAEPKYAGPAVSPAVAQTAARPALPCDQPPPEHYAPAGRPAAALPLYPEENLARRGGNVRLQSGASGLAAPREPFGFIETSNRRPGKPALPRTCGPALKAAWNFRRQTLNGVTYGEESLYPTGA